MAVSLIILDIQENVWSVCYCFCSMFCRSMLANWASSAVVDSCSSRSLMRVSVSSLIADTGLNGSPHIGIVRSHFVDSPASPTARNTTTIHFGHNVSAGSGCPGRRSLCGSEPVLWLPGGCVRVAL